MQGSDHYALVGGRDTAWAGVALGLFVFSFAYAVLVTEVFVHLDERLLLVPLLFAVGVPAAQAYRDGGLVVSVLLGVAPLAPAAVALPSILGGVFLLGSFLGIVGFGIGAGVRSLRRG